MARTKQEVRDFLNSQVGQKVNAKAGIYNGQCVSLIKALLEFLGVNNPYGARGNAKDVGDTLLREGVAHNGGGWLTVIVNRDMGLIDGVRYGHIWLDLNGEANFEQNGARALYTTKNTRPRSQGQQEVNLDHLLAPDPAPAPKKSNEEVAAEVLAGAWGNNPERREKLVAAGYDYNAIQAIVNGKAGNTAAPRKSNEVIADEVIAGAWGNGDDRKARLAAAGYDYAAVQAIVNSRVPANPAPKLSNEQVADQVIAQAWGNGQERKDRLAAAGYSYNAVQAIVNARMGTGTAGRKSNDVVANEIIAGLWGKGQERKDRLAAAGYDYGAVQALVNRKLGL